jgi:TRAP-type C4-dicarboxylate transport system permease small subunit
MRGWQRVDNWIKSFERFLLVLGMGMIMVFGSLDIILRNIFGWGLMFADTLARQLTIWLGLLGASVAASSSEHISIDAFSYLLKRRGL